MAPPHHNPSLASIATSKSDRTHANEAANDAHCTAAHGPLPYAFPPASQRAINAHGAGEELEAFEVGAAGTAASVGAVSSTLRRFGAVSAARAASRARSCAFLMSHTSRASSSSDACRATGIGNSVYQATDTGVRQ